MCTARFPSSWGGGGVLSNLLTDANGGSAQPPPDYRNPSPCEQNDRHITLHPTSFADDN